MIQKYVSTRFVGSKRRIAPWIMEHISDIHFSSALDAFGGTGSISYELKRKGKRVIYNDLLRTCYYSGLALIENPTCNLNEDEIEELLDFDGHSDYKGTLKPYDGIYYTPEENQWLEVMFRRINRLQNRYQRALAFHALTQSCLVKRPFNLFHRKNLYLRLANVKRSFRNNLSWEKPFPSLFKYFVIEANSRVFNNGQKNIAMNKNAFSFKKLDVDVVYLDPPYIHPDGDPTDYYKYYGFLEWLYCGSESTLDEFVLHKSKSHKWTRGTALSLIDQLFEKFKESIIILSYRSPSIPDTESIKEKLCQYKNVRVFEKDHQYVLSKDVSKEVLLIGT